MADSLADEPSPSILRATAQRAGSLVLWAPRQAIDYLPNPVPHRLRAYLPSFDWGDAFSSLQQPTPGATTAQANPPTSSSSSSSPSSSSSGLITFPSPITFLTSSYLFTSLLLAFLLHRIHHLVPPRNRSTNPFHNNNPRRAPDASLRRVLGPAVQLGCRAPGMLLMLKAVAGLALALTLSGGNELSWLKQGGEPGWLQWVAKGGANLLVYSTVWAGKGTLGRFLATTAGKGSVVVDHPSLLWQTFLSIALSLSCETFVRALSDDLPSVHHFNLLSFSFLLHVHSASTSAGGKPTPAGGSSGDAELYIYLLLTLLELLTLQTSYCLPFVLPSSSSSPQSRRRLPSAARARPYRLPITAFFSLLSQFFAIRSWVRIFSSPPAAATGKGPAMRSADLEIFSTIWLNKVPEVCFEVIVGVSLGLKAVAGLIRAEEMTLDNIVGHPASAPSREEDYAVALIKYTTHLLSSTRLSGLALELSPLEVLPLSLSTPLSSLGFLPPSHSSHSHLSDAELETLQRQELEALGGAGTGVVLRGNGEVWFDEPVPVSELRQRATGGGGARSGDDGDESGSAARRQPDGFAHEIRRITVEDRSNPFPSSEGEVDLAAHLHGAPSTGGGPLSMIQLEGQRKHVLWRFIALCARIGLYLVWRVQRAVKGAMKGLWRRARGRADEGRLEREWRPREKTPERERGRRRRAASPAWGAEDGEEEDAEFLPDVEEEEEDEDEGWTSGSENGEEFEVRSAAEEGDEEDEASDLPSALSLYSDLRYPPSSPASSRRPNLPSRPSTDLVPYSPNIDAAPAEELAPYLLAHQLSSASTGGMLTRRRYRALLPSSSSSGTPSSPSHSHSHSHSHSDCNHASPSAVEATSSAISSRRRDVLSFFATSASAAGEPVDESMEQKREEWREGRSRFCVVCTVEERSVVLWPCRCLCLCDPCRAALADRTTSSSSSALEDNGGGGQGSGGGICPTCRTPVVGFSRIYVP